MKEESPFTIQVLNQNLQSRCSSNNIGRETQNLNKIHYHGDSTEFLE